MVKYILSGDAREVEKVLQENRIRCQRGLIQFTLVAESVVADPKGPIVVDVKDVNIADDKKPKDKRAKKSE